MTPMLAILDRLPPIDWGAVALAVGLTLLHAAVLAALVRMTSDEGAKQQVTFGLSLVVYLLAGAGMYAVWHFAGPHLGVYTPLAAAAVPALLLMFFFRLGLGQVLVVMAAFVGYLLGLYFLMEKLRPAGS
jgi:hypothetical protein